MKQKHLKAGNSKLHNSCLISTLPTSICFGKGKQCKGCYALKAEKLYPSVLPCRMRHLKETQSITFVTDLVQEIIKSKKTKVRIHESGDMYSQKYLDRWAAIAMALPNVRFYLFTKKEQLDWSAYDALPNTNRIHSVAPDGGLNYGNMERVQELKAMGYHVCPCGIEKEHYSYTLSGRKVLRNKNKICMNTCNACLYLDKVAFLKH